MRKAPPTVPGMPESGARPPKPALPHKAASSGNLAYAPQRTSHPSIATREKNLPESRKPASSSLSSVPTRLVPAPKRKNGIFLRCRIFKTPANSSKVAGSINTGMEPEPTPREVNSLNEEFSVIFKSGNSRRNILAVSFIFSPDILYRHQIRQPQSPAIRHR